MVAFTAAVFAYFVSVINRSSMGVASIEAAESFNTTATQLAAVTVLQLVVYATMQIPVGVLVDRFGPKVTITTGVAFVSLGQVVVAFSESIAQVIVGRAILGFGDAFTFVSLVRIVQVVVSKRRVTRMQLLATNLGQLGQLISALPFGWLLAKLGWQQAFLVVGLAAALASLLSGIAIRVPKLQLERGKVDTRTAFKGVLLGLQSPFVRLAFWTHFTLQSATSIFLLLWGFPYLVAVQKFSEAMAGLFLGFLVVAGLFIGFVYSGLATRFPARRSNLVIATGMAVILSWIYLLINPGQDSWIAVVVLGFVLSCSGPASMLAFDFTRSYVPAERTGSANGIANIGGFLATFLAIFFVGLISDLTNTTEKRFEAANLESGMWVMPLVALLGLVFFILERERCRALLRSQGQEFIPLRKVLNKKLSFWR